MIALALLVSAGVATATGTALTLPFTSHPSHHRCQLQLLGLWQLLLCVVVVFKESPLPSPSRAQMTPPVAPSPKSSILFLASTPLSLSYSKTQHLPSLSPLPVIVYYFVTVSCAKDPYATLLPKSSMCFLTLTPLLMPSSKIQQLLHHRFLCQRFCLLLSHQN